MEEYFINSCNVPTNFKVNHDKLKNVENLDRKNQLKVLSLIRTYQLIDKTNTDNLHDIPYKGKDTRKGLVFYLDNMPDKLQYVICKFTDLLKK